MDIGTLETLESARGTYILILHLPGTTHLAVGRLGAFDLKPGYYIYAGSALGSGGLRARLGHHLGPIENPHWHIDYLLPVTRPVEIWVDTSGEKLEKHFVQLLEADRTVHIPIARFGSSDYRRSRGSHLFHRKQLPRLPDFNRQWTHRHGGTNHLQQIVIEE